MPNETVPRRRGRKLRAAQATLAAECADRSAKPESDGEATVEREPAFRLPETLDLAAAGPLAAELMARRGKPITVDAGAVKSLGTPVLQVLIAAIRSWERDGAPFALVNCGPELVERVRLLGVERGLPLKDVEP